MEVSQENTMTKEQMRIQYAIIRALEECSKKSELIKFYGLPEIKRKLRKQAQEISPWLDGRGFLYKKLFFSTINELINYLFKTNCENNKIIRTEIKYFKVGDKYILFHIV